MTPPLPSRRAFLGLAAFAVLTAVAPDAKAQAGAPGTFSDLLPHLRWDPGQFGPLLVVAPESAALLLRLHENAPAGTPIPPSLPEPTGDGSYDLRQSLPAFGRRLFPMGTLSVVAPIEMTVLADTPPNKPPNLWVDLSRDLRIRYLLSTLTAVQWAQIGSSQGLGAADLISNDQQNVFMSLLPDPMIVRTTRIANDGFPDLTARVSRTLSQAERAQVRLRAQRAVQLEIPEKLEAHTVTPAADDYTGEPGDTWTDWQDDEINGDSRSGDRKASVYGVPFVTRSRNILKPSDIDYAAPALQQTVALQDSETIGSLTKRIAATVGWELIADFRVASLSVYTRGSQCSAGDLLSALAFGLCGTWRRVDGQTYLLAADRTGAGTRKLRLATWQAELDQKVFDAQNDWEKAIAKSGGVKAAVKYAANDPLKPPDDVLEKVESNVGTGDEYDVANLTPVDTLSPAERLSLQRQFATNLRLNPKQAAENDPDHVHLTPKVKAGFVLPDGTSLPADIDLGEAFLLENTGDPDAPAAVMPNEFKAVKGKFPLPGGMRHSVFLSAEKPGDAVNAVVIARRFGFDTVYIATDDPASLAAAVIEGRRRSANGGKMVSVGAVIDAFGRMPDTPREALDINIVGESPLATASNRALSPIWARFIANIEPSFPFSFAGELLARDDDSLPPLPARNIAQCVNRIADVARAEGLVSLLINEPIPPGYTAISPDQLVSGATKSPVTAARDERGYTSAMRLAFLRQEGIDPIDLLPSNIDFKVDLRQPFFADNDARGRLGLYLLHDPSLRQAKGYASKRTAWNSFRASENRKALSGIFSAVKAQRPALPVFVAAQAASRVRPNEAIIAPAFYPWKSPDKLPAWSKPSLFEGNAPSHDDGIHPLRFWGPGGGGDSGKFLGYLLKSASDPDFAKRAPFTGDTLTLDLSPLPLAVAQNLLETWVKPAVDAL